VEDNMSKVGINLIVETDIGRDPDDYFALLYLISTGINIKAICISPGDPDQIAVARFLCEKLGVDCPIGAGKPDRDKSSCSGFHTALLKRHGAPLKAEADGLGKDIINDYYGSEDDLFLCGPLNSVGKYLRMYPCRVHKKVTMQGGFLGYHLHTHDCPKLEKFIGKSEVPTFNLNGDKKGGEAFIKAPIEDRKFVSKNVCHTIVYDTKIHKYVKSVPPNNFASQLLREGMDLYLEKHPEGKKFHDPSAAVCHLHPDVATWVRGDLYRKGGGWGTSVSDNGKSQITAAINYDLLWKYIAEGR
jgi:inosine-uridine nucleoside N-ribohydrolase